MQWILLIVICFSVGSWLFKRVVGKGVADAVDENPARGIAGILFFAIVVFFGLALFGLLIGGN